MTSQQILHADALDILFEKQNKMYGAYQLRQLYPRQLTKAVLLALCSVLILLALVQPSVEKSTPLPISDGVVVTTVDALPPEPKKPEPPKLPRAENTPVKQQTFIDQIAIVEEDVQTVMPPVDALQNAAISDKTTHGEDVGTLQPSIVPVTSGMESMPQTETAESQREVVPDQQPQFPGGMLAWLTFLSQNLQAPQELEPGEKRTALIRFHVAEDGRVTNFQVVQSAGGTFDNEVIRVLKKMPKWAPATKAGDPVAVSFTQPVTFVGAEE